MKFIVALHTDDGVSYGATVPDLPGAFSAGDSLDEVLENVVEAIVGVAETYAEMGTEFPVAKTAAEHTKNPDLANADIWAVVDAPVEIYFSSPAERVNITMPGLLLSKIDRFAKSQGETRSGFLTRAALVLIKQSSRG